MTATTFRRPDGRGEPSSIAEVTDAHEWDSLVDASEDASFCHRWAWRGIIGEVSGHECLQRGARDETGTLTGILPLVHLRTRLFGSHLVSVPFLNYGGPAGAPAARHSLARWALEEARRLGVDSLLLRTRRPIPGDLPSVTSKVTVVLPLPPTSEELWNKSFNAKFRGKIKRPQRDGMATQFGPAHLGAFYEVFAENMRDLGTPVLPMLFFERIVAAFPELVVLGVTYWNGRPVAGGFGFLWRGEFEMTWSSSAKALRAQKPNMLLYWDFMRELIGLGAKAFNFGRSTPGSGPHEFKRSWGAVDEPLPWIQWPDAGGTSGESRSARLASRVWQHLPLAVANTLGPRLSRQLPWW
jgi:FemAB-related protein (PEP-CTERM system-associated)